MLTKNDIKIIRNIKQCLGDVNQVQGIVDATANTWQPTRTAAGKLADTGIGKTAECIVENYIKNNLKNIIYISYDDIRTDNLKKHAPFDGLLCAISKDKLILQSLINKINQQIKDGDTSGKITDELKDELFQNHIYTVEIKSTRTHLTRHYIKGQINIELILNDDFLEYPKHLRENKDGVCDILSYSNYCYKKGFIDGGTNDDLISEVKNMEQQNMRNIYIRVYIDSSQDTGYIVGCIGRKRFIDNCIIKQMFQPKKSEKALYLATSLKNGSNIDDLGKIV